MTYDFVVVGAGSAGCVLAGRLSERGRRVLLLEAGGSDRKMEIRIPAAFARLFRSDVDWAFTTEPQAEAGGRRLFMPRGRVVGGSSSLNAMIYVRGRRHDYDTWARLGAAGWSYDDVLPYFKRSERNARLGEPFHGTAGPLHVEDRRYTNPLSMAFVRACAAVGIPGTDDFNGERQDGAGLCQVTQRRGRRWSAADAFLRPALDRPELEIVVGALVERVLFDATRAVGVEYRRAGSVEIATVEGEVLLAAGAIGTPQLLARSGVGPADELRALGIDVVADHPHVGRHLQDHPVVGCSWEVTRPGVTLDDADRLRHLVRWRLTSGGKLASNVAEALAFVRTEEGLPVADLQFHFAPAWFQEHGFRGLQGSAFTVGPTLLVPRSRGTVRLGSPDPRAAPRIDPGVLTEPEDLRHLVEGTLLAREIAARAALDPWRGRELEPGTEARTRDQLVDWVRARVELLYHPSGTCRIGPEDDGVVDARLRVHGLEGIRVADASVFPLIPGGNTNAAAIMVGERAADMVAP